MVKAHTFFNLRAGGEYDIQVHTEARRSHGFQSSELGRARLQPRAFIRRMTCLPFQSILSVGLIPHVGYGVSLTRDVTS